MFLKLIFLGRGTAARQPPPRGCAIDTSTPLMRLYSVDKGTFTFTTTLSCSVTQKNKKRRVKGKISPTVTVDSPVAVYLAT